MKITTWFYSRILAIILCVVCFASVCWPQASTSTVLGTVRDQSKAVVVDASVTLTNTGTNVTSKTVTNQAGLYVLPGVLPGPYRLLVEAPGMQRFEGTLTVQVQQDAVVDAVLNVGQVTAEVSVQDVTPILVADNPTLGHVLERQRIEQLPINSRYVQSLFQTVPGMEGWRTYGQRMETLEWVQDGAVANSRFAPVLNRPPGLDTIEEFKVETSNSSAKFTRPTTVVMSTKSGTNTLHGAMFETARNNAIGTARARTDFYTKAPHLVRNEFGASAGGPVYLPKLYNGRNRSFWFFAWEEFRNMSSTSGAYQTIPEAMRNGDFRGLVDGQGRQIRLYDPLTTNSTNWSRLPMTYKGQANVIDPARLDAVTKFVYGFTPLPTNPEVNPLVDNNWYGQVPSPQRQRTFTARFDHRFSDRDNFYARYTKSDDSRVVPNGMPMLNGIVNNYSGIGPNQNLALSYVHIFSPTLFNELVVSGHRDIRGSNYDRNTRYLDILNLPNPLNLMGWPLMGSTGLGTLSYNAWTRNGSAINYFLLDNGVTKMHGRHQLQFGVHIRNDQLNVTPNANPLSSDWATLGTALYDPSSSRTNPLAAPQTGHNLANMYLGLMNYSAQMVRGYYYERAREFALYFQDNFKVTPRLTLNLGLRWDMWPSPRDKYGIMSGYDTERKAVVLGADLDTIYKLGYSLPSIVNRIQSLGAKFESYKDAGLPQSLMYTNWKNFGPRLGFAYQAGQGKSSLVVRGGYRVSYFTISLDTWTQALRLQPPFTATFPYQLNNATQSPDGIPNYLLRTAPTVYAGVNSRNVIDLGNASSISRGSSGVPYFDPHQPDAQVQDWNLTLEKELMANTVARVAYIGNHSAHLNQNYLYNENTPDYIWFVTTGQALPTGAYANVARRPFDQEVFGSYSEYRKTGWSNYGGMQFELERRYHKGYGFQLYYLINNSLASVGYPTTANNVPGTNQFLPGTVPEDYDQRNRFLNYGRDTGVPKHRVRWNWIADLPFGRGKALAGNANGVLNKIIGGWQVAGMGSLGTSYFALPTNIYPAGDKIEMYGYKYPVQDCRSGACWPGYLWWNGYIPANQINSVDASGKPNGVMGVPADYKPAGQPLLPWPKAPDRNDPMFQYYGTNTVWVTLKNGTSQRTTYNPGLHPWQNQYFPSVRQWGLDASLFKTIAIRDRVQLRFNADFFNVLNHPGNQNSVGGDGVLDTRASGNAARVLQLTLRLTW